MGEHIKNAHTGEKKVETKVALSIKIVETIEQLKSSCDLLSKGATSGLE